MAQLSSSSYYYARNEKLKHDDTEVINLIKEIKKTDKNKGYVSVTTALRRDYNQIVNHKKVYRIMGEYDLLGKLYNQKSRKYSSFNPNKDIKQPNRINNRFITDRPGQKIANDITEFKTKDRSKIYLSANLDMFSGEIVSYQISKHPNTELVLKPLKRYLSKRPDYKYRMTVHTDHGVQYSSGQYKHYLKENKVFQSMSRKGKPRDNAPMESFFHLLKIATIHSYEYETYSEMKVAIDKWIYYYNNKRYKEKLGGLSPVEYRIKHTEKVI